MATVTYHPQSFLFPFWQNVIDFNASLIPIPLGMVSGTLSGFAFENVDGTYTIFLGTDIVVGESAPISGTATEIVRRSTLDPFGVHYADITDSFPATGAYEAFRDGGTEFFASVLSGGSIDGAIAYKQLRESANPYDPKFEQPTGTATVEPIVPLQDAKGDAPSPNDQHPRNS